MRYASQRRMTPMAASSQRRGRSPAKNVRAWLNTDDQNTWQPKTMAMWAA